MSETKTCCICGIALPNRYAVGGVCDSEACAAAFCRLHWSRGNHRCPAHGYCGSDAPAAAAALRPDTGTAGSKPENEGENPAENDPMNDTPKPEDAKKKTARLSPEKAKKVMAETVRLVARLGKGAAGLLARLRKEKSPESMLAALEQGMADCVARREAVAGKLEQQHALVVDKKKTYESASPVRRRILEAELKTALAAYKATERQMQVLLENERILAQVVGRIREMMAYDMAAVDEDLIDDLAVDLEDRIDAAEARVDAARDLDKAGRRRDRESDRDSLWDELAGFDEASPAAAGLQRELAGFELGDAPPAAVPPRPEPEP